MLYQQKNWDEKGEIFVDPNKFSEDGTTSINQQSWSEDGSIFAYGISEKGSDWVTLKVCFYLMRLLFCFIIIFFGISSIFL